MARSTHHTYIRVYLLCTLAQSTCTTYTLTRARTHIHRCRGHAHWPHAHAHTHYASMHSQNVLLSFFFPYLAKRKKKLYQIDHYLLVIFSSRSINLLSISLSFRTNLLLSSQLLMLFPYSSHIFFIHRL